MHPGELVDILDTSNEDPRAVFARGIFVDEYVNDWSGPAVSIGNYETFYVVLIGGRLVELSERWWELRKVTS